MSAVTGIAHLCDSRGVIWRPREPAVRDELGDVVEVYDDLPAPAGLNCRANQNWSGDLQDNGPGEQQGAKRQWFLVSGFDAKERDVLSVDEGPEAPLLLRIHSVTKLTRLLHPTEVHHFEVNVEVWPGPIVDAEDYS